MLVIDNEFVTQWKPLVLKIIGESGQVSCPDDRDEILHKTWVNLLVNARYYTSKYAVSTFIRLQTTNAIGSFIRGDVEDVDAMQHKVTSEYPEEEAEQEIYTDVEHLLEQINPYLEYLDDVERAIFIDRVVGKMSVSDVAEKHDVHCKSVSRILTRVTNKLKSIMTSGKRISPYREVSTDIPLETAIMQMDDAHYHTFRMHHFRGMSLINICELNGMSIDRNFQLLAEARQMVEQEWGVRI